MEWELGPGEDVPLTLGALGSFPERVTLSWVQGCEKGFAGGGCLRQEEESLGEKSPLAGERMELKCVMCMYQPDTHYKHGLIKVKKTKRRKSPCQGPGIGLRCGSMRGEAVWGCVAALVSRLGCWSECVSGSFSPHSFMPWEYPPPVGERLWVWG